MTELETFQNKIVQVLTRDGQLVLGKLKGFDQTVNIILTESKLRNFSEEGTQEVQVGLQLIRGDNIALISEVDEELDDKINWESEAMVIANWNDPLDDVTWTTAAQQYSEIDETNPKSKRTGIFYLKLAAFFLATLRNVSATYISHLWAIGSGDKQWYIAHRIIVMLTWIMTFYLLYYRFAVTFRLSQKKSVLVGKFVLGFLVAAAIAECFGCLVMSYTDCWNIFEPALSIGVLLSTVYFDLYYMISLCFLFVHMKSNKDTVKAIKYLSSPLETMIVCLLYCITAWIYFLNTNTEYTWLTYFSNTWWNISWSLIPFIVIRSSSNKDIKKLTELKVQEVVTYKDKGYIEC
ncbi:N(alpha)-acetyltransferase 38, NatC auxiliary [Clydaea vesicula]|uniref:N(Alpha)-acetyltransferase 38, NatC auxiliary n=1 Tax=Clydaea vesicula TaxID=447962 RepID=A0AAD5Y207_9FUNG|nr:N(alpha)-acetyltransferase 38, NatC auxiliary [Clydaea vesicula]